MNNICKKRFLGNASAHIIRKAIAALAVLVFSGIAYAREKGPCAPEPATAVTKF